MDGVHGVGDGAAGRFGGGAGVQCAGHRVQVVGAGERGGQYPGCVPPDRLRSPTIREAAAVTIREAAAVTMVESTATAIAPGARVAGERRLAVWNATAGLDLHAA